ncbi:Abi family protein [Absiella sp. AM29-15]|uniref:Abi family protein n=1 Tax=Absiella sp. AM29-15 TaxID=2292278 RepID=UPI000E40CCAA|nr:Abi family protein [Absiella sp. AM29-15]RGC52559.1 Abi family protein [Absiella sp. AM29-15]
MSYEKQYVPFSDLIEMLKEDKNINVHTLKEKIFKERTYVSIINPYKDYLCLEKGDVHRVYPNNLDFKYFKKFIEIDDFISTRLNIYIKCFEQALTAYLATTMSNKMLKLGNVHCNDYSLFQELLSDQKNQLDMLDIYHRYQNTKIVKGNDLVVQKNREVVEKIIMLGQKKLNMNNYLYQHYKKNHTSIPIWIVIHQLTLGELQAIFNLLKLKDRVAFVNNVYRQRKNNQFVSTFSNKINYIRLLRNNINHYEPIIPFIKNLSSLEEQKRLISLIKLLKINYYESTVHDCSKIEKPVVDIYAHQNNALSISYIKKIIKII